MAEGHIKNKEQLTMNNTWQIKTLQELGTFSKGAGISKADILPEGLPCIRYAEIYTKYDFQAKTLESFISRETADQSKHITKGTLLFAGSGETAEEIGKSIAYTGNETAYAGGDTIIFNFTNPQENTLFYSYYLNTTGRRQINKLGEGQSIVHIYPAELAKVKVPVPPLSEQHRIVAVLETWDKAISLTKRLIEQKELQKRHLMQQLLTGKTRLKGFSGKWEKHILSDFTYRITRRNTENNKNVVTISAKFGFIPQTTFFSKNIASSSIENYFLVYKNEFCYNKSYSQGYPSGTIKRLKDFEKAVVTPLYICFAIKDNNQLNYNFFEQYCETGLFNRHLDKIANEGGRAHGLLNVSVNDFFKLPLNVPSIKEQQAIAEILSAADRDISLLKEKLAKLQQQKKGLMQILLTGKVRLN